MTYYVGAIALPSPSLPDVMLFQRVPGNPLHLIIFIYTR